MCVPSEIFGCQLHCFDTEDESLGDWYEPNGACAIIRNPSEIDSLITRVIKNPKTDPARNVVVSYVNQRIESYQKILNLINNSESSGHNICYPSIRSKQGNKYKPK